MSYLVFPTALFVPASLRPRIIGAASTGGPAIGGGQQFGSLSGGGRWALDFGESTLWSREKVMAWRAFAAASDNGATPTIVPLADRRHQPIASVAPGSVAFDDAALWDDASSWTAMEVDAVLTADAALRATQLHFTYTAPRALVGGEFLAILGSRFGWRWYEVIRVNSGGLGSGDATVVTIRTPLREAAAASTPLNFDSPRCLMRLDGDAGVILEQLRFGKGPAIRFVETFPTPD